MNDVLEVLDDLEDLLGTGYGEIDRSEIILFIEQKRSEYEEPKGDCCG